VLRTPASLDVAKAPRSLRYAECEGEIEMTLDKRKDSVAISSLSDAQLIYILQRVDVDEGEELTQFVEAEIARRKIQGGALQ
jgi:hypothetical protein